MQGKEFKEIRILMGFTLREISPLLGYKTISGYRHHEEHETKELPIIFEMFYNYVNRYGLEIAKKEFKKRFKNG